MGIGPTMSGIFVDLLRPLAHRSQVLLLLLLHQGSDLSHSFLRILRLTTATRILIKALLLPVQELRWLLVCFPISHQGQVIGML